MPIDPLDLPIGANRFWPEAVQALETHGQQVRDAIAALESDSGTSVSGSFATYADLPQPSQPGKSYVVRDEVALYVADDAGGYHGPFEVDAQATDAAVADKITNGTATSAALPDAIAAAVPSTPVRGALDNRYARTSPRPVNILERGADPTGATDASAIIRQALADSTTVDFGRGGTFTVSRDSLLGYCIGIPGGRTITGNGATVRLANGSSITSLLQPLGNDVTIRDLAIDGNRANVSEEATHQRHGIFLDNVSDVRIIDVDAFNTAGDGILFWRNTHRITVRGGSHVGHRRNAISMTGNGEHIIIDKVEMHRNIDQHPMDIEVDAPSGGYRFIRITGCSIGAGLNTGAALGITGTSAPAEDVLIDGCTILGRIDATDFRRVTMRNNTIDVRGKGKDAVVVAYGADGFRFDGNDVFNDSTFVGLRGDWVSGQTFECDRWSITGNEFRMGSGAAVRLAGILRSTVRGNRASGTDGTSYGAFRASATRTVKATKFIDNEAWGYNRGVVIEGPNSHGRIVLDGNHAHNDVTGMDYSVWLTTSATPAVVSVNNTADSGITIPASTPAGLWVRTGGNMRPVFEGTGSPEGVLAAAVGAVALRRDGAAATVMYVKESGTGSTGWVAK